ncbi:MFS transporter [Aestuariicella sp. G3-2]|uniref:MFS transporter n=1 Tax=Pseudomaricurvus albidus TaxID=2842452 RepID=UPI001C0B80E6|nr:MFS transporter [Aestuariicella albida]MBU3068389.1 MFS transporter [Aestuariicella albida]
MSSELSTNNTLSLAEPGNRRTRFTLPTLIAMGVLGDSIILIIPMLVSGWVESRGFSESQAGYLSALEMCGLAVAGLVGLYWLHRINWRKVAMLALSGMLIGNLLTLGIQDFSLFAIVRLLTGFCAGTLTALAWVAIAQTSQPDRAFGIIIGAEVIFAAVAVWALPYLMVLWGVNAAYVLLIVFALLVMTGISHIPSDHADGGVDSNNGVRIPWRACVVLLALGCFFATQGAVWTYVERIGDHSGFTTEDIGMALSISNLAAIAGASVPVILGVRFGRLLPIGLNLIAQLWAISVLVDVIPFSRYLVAISLFNFAWNLLIPYLLGLLADIDHSGKGIVISNVFVWGGFSVGPAIASWLLESHGLSVVNVVGGIGAIACLGLIVLSQLKTPRSSALNRGQNLGLSEGHSDK